MNLAKVLTELTSRVANLESRQRQFVGGSSVTTQPPVPLRKFAKVTERVTETISTGGGGYSQVYTYSWRGVEHEPLNGALYVGTENDSGYRNLRHVDNAAIGVGSIVEIFRHPHKSESFWFTAGGASSGLTPVRIVAGLSAQEQCSGSGEESGSESGSYCPSRFMLGRVQVRSDFCEGYYDGACVWVSELRGVTLEPGRVYFARLIGDAPDSLQAIPVDISQPDCASAVDLYEVDVGDRVLSVVPVSEYGTLCESGSGITVGGGSNLTLYEGYAERYDAETCAWVRVEDCMIAESHDCPMTLGERYEGRLEDVIPEHLIDGGSGSITGHCYPLYLVTQPLLSGVKRIECEGDCIRVVYYNGCPNEEVSQLLCCDDTSGSGGESIPCGFDAAPECYTFDVAGLSGSGPTATCCDALNRTYTLCWSEANNAWVEDATGFTCGTIGILNFSLTCTVIGGTEYMVLNLGFATYRLEKSSWNVLGSNVMDKYGTDNPSCSGAPATITVTAV